MSTPPTTSSTLTLQADTGATDNFVIQNEMSNIHQTPTSINNPAINVIVPNGATMQSNSTMHLPIPGLPPSATKAHGFNNLASGSLLSVGKVCDANCTAIFTKTNMHIYHNKDVSISTGQAPIITGTRDAQHNPLWSVKLPSPPSHHNNATIGYPSLKERISFYHTAMFSPTLPTWCKAIDNGHLKTWPGLTATQIRRNPPPSEATIKGHLHAQRSNIRSTKLYNAANTIQTNDAKPTDLLPLLPNHLAPFPDPAQTPSTNPVTSQRNEQNVYISCHHITGKTYSDQTGRFICPSISGNNYIFLLYNFDTNSIHAEPIPSRTKHQLLNAFKKICTSLQQRGFQPKLHHLDNEISTIFKEHLKDQHIAFQLTPEGLHRRNLAERAIQTFKNHFLAGLCSTHPDFPLALWDKILPQAIITLNLLRSSRIQPQISAHEHVFGPLDFRKTPFAPPGIKVLVHVRPQNRSSWAPHAVQGWYIGPSLDHYRCHRVWVPSTRSERISQTLSWFPHHVTMPVPTNNDMILAAAKDLTEALLNKPKNTSTIDHEPHVKQLKQLGDIFTNHAVPTPCTTGPLPRVSLRQELFPDCHAPTDLASTNITTTSAPELSLRQELFPERFSKLRPQNALQPVHKKPDTSLPRVSLREELFPTSHRPNLAPTAKPTLPPTNHNKPVMNAVFNEKTGKYMEYRELLKGPDRDLWYNGGSKEFARLLNGRKKDNMKGTNSMHFIRLSELPPGKIPTYLRVCANYRPQKEDPYRLRFTIGGNLINYDGDTYTPNADLTTAKTQFNSVVSTPDARFMVIDISNFYLNTPLPPAEREYMWIEAWMIPQDIMDEYDVHIVNGRALVEITNAMYGLPQAGRLAYNKLEKHLADDGYHPCKLTPGVFRHVTRPISFCLVVDDFGIKFVGKENADHLVTTLRKHYDITIDWEGKTFCGIHLKWDYKNNHVDLSMPKYVNKALKRFDHPDPPSPEHSPHPWTAPKYGQKVQYAKILEKNTNLTPKQRKLLQEFIGTFLFYARAIDNTMLEPIGTIATAMTTSTWDNLSKRMKQFLDYAATHPDATIRFKASEMHLWLHSDSSYLNEPKARSRAGGYFYLSDKPKLPIKSTDPMPTLNAPIHVNSKVIDAVMSSAQEAETGAGFFNAKDAVPLRQTLEDLGHPQGPTPIQFDNACATGILNDKVKQRRSRAMDMRFYWLRDRVRQKQFHIYWKRGITNLADYFTKNHPTSHHIEMRPTYVLNYLSTIHKHHGLQGCVESISQGKIHKLRNRPC